MFGPRQTGKSTLIQGKFTDKVWIIDLLLNDVYLLYSRDTSPFRNESIEKIKNEGIKTIVIDEVQRVPELLNEVQYLMQNFKCQFIMTGSSARKLKRGGANLLGGRAIQKVLFPFTYEETEEIFKLEDALQFGTLPPIIKKITKEKTDILHSYVNTYLREEIQSEGIVRNLGGFARFLDMSANQFGEVTSFSNIARECQLPVRTVQSYYEILENTLIGFKLEPWRKSIRKRLAAHPKFYFFDCGVTNAINKRLTAPLDTQLRGRLFEQWIILETSRFIHYLQSETNIFYWRTNHGAEVDLLIEKHGKLKAAVEIKFTSNISTSHLSGLRAFREENPQVQAYIVCNAKNNFELDKVKVINWRNYLKMLPKLAT
ncbi:MAG: ATP-binding protein [Candidatus Melainabacteria bacterium]|nr:ATP-binding protein [Candidatus Melainabacteria bacterium]